MTHDDTKTILLIVGVVVFAFASPAIVRFFHGYIAGMIWQWRELKAQHQQHQLIVMRRADMLRIHPDQISAKCSMCNEEVAVYPSGQRVMRDVPSVKLVCQVCHRPGGKTKLAAGAEREAMESVRDK